MEVRTGLRYTEEHEWIETGEEVARVGITDWAQDNLTDVVYVELPDEGTEVDLGAEFAVLESVKAAAEVYAPASGEIVEVNGELEDRPELINESPYDDGWICAIRLSEAGELDELMDADAYQAYTDEL